MRRVLELCPLNLIEKALDDFERLLSPEILEKLKNKEWAGKSLGIVGDYLKPGPLSVEKKFRTGEWKTNPYLKIVKLNETNMSKKEAIRRLRAICRLYVFLAPNSASLKIAQDLLSYKDIGSEFVFGSICFANLDRKSGKVNGYVKIAVFDLLHGLGEAPPIAELARYGCLTEGILDLILSKAFVDELCDDWRNTLDGIPIFAWLYWSSGNRTS